MKILFVDDELAILRAIRRILRRLANRHAIDLEPSYRAAIERLREGGYHLVVTDVRMADRGGEQVLTAAADYNPSCVRAIFSGFSGEEELALAARHAHLFISKPFETTTILDLLARAEVLGAMPVTDAVRQCLGCLQALPSPTAVTRELVMALRDDQCAAPSMQEIAAIIEQDMGISAKVLQLANSAFFGVAGPVLKLDQAVKRLGTRMISGLLLQQALFRAVTLPGGLERWRDDLNRQALESAKLAARMAGDLRLSRDAQAEASLAGLLHDAGRLVLVAEFADQEHATHVLEFARGRNLCALEERLFGVHHGWIGAYLLRLWGLPAGVVDAAAYHHAPAAAGQSGLSSLTLVHIADALVRADATREFDLELDLDLAYLQHPEVLGSRMPWKSLSKPKANFNFANI